MLQFLPRIQTPTAPSMAEKLETLVLLWPEASAEVEKFIDALLTQFDKAQYR